MAVRELATFAVLPNESKGRAYNEDQSNYRNEFQRDRDRIIHSSAFRRLEYKTQVFVNHEGDMFWGVTRGMEYLYTNIPHFNLIAIVNGLRMLLSDESVLPLSSAFPREQKRGIRPPH